MPDSDTDHLVCPPLSREPVCVVCAVALPESYGWCGTCRAAFCGDCGPSHFCTPACPAAGCHAGLCVRLVRGGAVLPDSWGMRE